MNDFVYLVVSGAEADLGQFEDNAAVPCQNTAALHWRLYCGSAGVGVQQTVTLGEVSEDVR